jgi:hypothetical protein
LQDVDRQPHVDQPAREHVAHVVGKMPGDGEAPPRGLGRLVDHPPAPRGAGAGVAVDAVEQHRALAGVEVGHQPQQHALARPRFAEDADALAALRLQVDGRAAPRAELANLEKGCRGSG